MKSKSLRYNFFGALLCVTLAAQAPSFNPPTPLLRAVLQNDTAAAEKLLAEGADPNEARFVGFPPVFFPVIHHNSRLLRAMKERGADLKAKDATGSNLLMWAAFTDTGNADLVRELLELGLDPNATDTKGESALTWALRRGTDTPAVRALRKAGASNASSAHRAAANAIALLQKSGPNFIKVSGCTSCHHQSLPQMANGFARPRGIPIDEPAAQLQVKAVIGFFSPLRQEMLAGTARLPDVPTSVGYTLLGLAAESYPPDETTRAMAHLISLEQRPDGSFPTLPVRPPMESSAFTAAALALRAIQLYGDSPQEKVQRAAQWLEKAQPQCTEDHAMQLLGLRWASADVKLLRRLARPLLASQHSDGGWSQLPGLESDAYATGQTLVALEQAGVISPTDPAFQRGVDFLIRTQRPDGSWLVRTRSFPVQKLKESGYPHGNDQWISAAGSSWAAMALSLYTPVRGD